MGIFDFFKKKKNVYDEAKIKQLSTTTDEQIEILKECENYFLTWKLINDGTMHKQINEYFTKIGVFLTATDIMMSRERAYYDIYHCCVQRYRDKFANENELFGDWYRNEWELVIFDLEDIFERFDGQIDIWQINSATSLWKLRDFPDDNFKGETVKECLMLDIFLITKLKSIISTIYNLIDNSHHSARENYKRFNNGMPLESAKTLLPKYFQ